MLVKLIENEWNEEYDEILEKLKTTLNPDSVIAFFSDYAFTFEHNSKTLNSGFCLNQISKDKKRKFIIIKIGTFKNNRRQTCLYFGEMAQKLLKI